MAEFRIPPQVRDEMRRTVQAICEEHLGPCIEEIERLQTALAVIEAHLANNAVNDALAVARQALEAGRET